MQIQRRRMVNGVRLLRGEANGNPVAGLVEQLPIHVI
jgi:hypothetical protein